MGSLRQRPQRENEKTETHDLTPRTHEEIVSTRHHLEQTLSRPLPSCFFRARQAFASSRIAKLRLFNCSCCHRRRGGTEMAPSSNNFFVTAAATLHRFFTTMSLFEFLGQALLTFLLVFFFLQFYNEPSGSATPATYLLIMGGLLGLRNSFFTLLLGMPFERQLKWHKLYMAVALVFVLLHTFLCVNKGLVDVAWRSESGHLEERIKPLHLAMEACLSEKIRAFEKTTLSMAAAQRRSCPGLRMKKKQEDEAKTQAGREERPPHGLPEQSAAVGSSEEDLPTSASEIAALCPTETMRKEFWKQVSDFQGSIFFGKKDVEAILGKREQREKCDDDGNMRSLGYDVERSLSEKHKAAEQDSPHTTRGTSSRLFEKAEYLRRYWYTRGYGSATSPRMMTGFIGTGAIILLVLLSLPWIRRNYFELFLYSHILLAIGSFLALVFHGAVALVAILICYGLDFGLRVVSTRLNKNKTWTVEAELAADDLVRLSWVPGGQHGGAAPGDDGSSPASSSTTASSLDGEDSSEEEIAGLLKSRPADEKELQPYLPGQYFFIRLPGVALFESHPFSVASSPHDEKCVVYVKVLGDWSKRLADLVKRDMVKGKQVVEMPAIITGPFGRPNVDLLAPSSSCCGGNISSPYSDIVFVAGGVGATPLLSICSTFVHDSLVLAKRGGPRQAPSLHFVWSAREMELFSCGESLEESALMLEAASQSEQSESEETSSLPTLTQHYHLTGDDASERIAAFGAASGKIKAGRPDVEKILADIISRGDDERQKSRKQRRIAILVCGPVPMIEAVESLAASFSAEQWDLWIDVHHELFEF